MLCSDVVERLALCSCGFSDFPGADQPYKVRGEDANLKKAAEVARVSEMVVGKYRAKYSPCDIQDTAQHIKCILRDCGLRVRQQAAKDLTSRTAYLVP